MKSINPKKIKLMRLMHRLSMDQLITLMGEDAVSKMAISKIERGLMRPSSKTLNAIAKAYNISTNYFFNDTISVSDMVFRSISGLSAKEKEQLEAKIIVTIQQYFDSESFNIHPIHFYNPMEGTILCSYSDAEDAAMILRKKWDIGIQPIFSAYELVQSYGIHVLEVDFGDNHIDGVSTFINWKNSAIPVMVINSRKNTTTERKRFTAFHELAHLLFILEPFTEEQHSTYLKQLSPLPYNTILKCPTEERLCNIFAGSMLLPTPCLTRRIGNMRRTIDISELISIRECYGISIAAIIHQLHDTRIIDEDLYNNLYDTLIKSNPMEEGWGNFPIMEKADMDSLLKIRFEKETQDNIH